MLVKAKCYGDADANMHAPYVPEGPVSPAVCSRLCNKTCSNFFGNVVPLRELFDIICMWVRDVVGQEPFMCSAVVCGACAAVSLYV